MDFRESDSGDDTFSRMWPDRWAILGSHLRSLEHGRDG